MRIWLSILFIIITSVPVFAQKEANNWYFGVRAGLTFQGGTASPLGNGQLYSQEGCATASDPKTGALLFYTDGINIWNRNHQVINSGNPLKGGPSSTQNALIVPNPANKLQYYVFTVPDLTSSGGVTTTALFYSLVSVENSDCRILSINNFLTYEVSEKLTGTLDCNGTGFWVIAHHRTKGIFYSYHVTASGVDAVPVNSTYAGRVNEFTAGYIKISPDRTKLALATNIKEGYIILFDFNAKTGAVSGYKYLGDETSLFSCYGVSFSPDNTKLYVSAATSPAATKYSVFQFDVSSSNLKTIQNSIHSLSVGGGFIGALQLAPDGKIYIAQDGSSQLGVIDQPNLSRDKCNYRANAIVLSGGCKWGLPNFMDYIFNNPGEAGGRLPACMPPRAIAKPDTGCQNSSMVFNDFSTFTPTKREWIFEKGTPPTSADSSVSVRFSEQGIHRVRLVVSNENGRDTTYTEAVVLSAPTADAGTDKTVCSGASTKLGVEPETGNKYSWQPTTNLSDATKANPTCSPKSGVTQYILSVTNAIGCVSYDTVIVTVGTIAAKVSGNIAMCLGSTIQLVASGGSDYSWFPITGLNNPNIPNPIASPVSTTEYQVVVSSGSCADTAAITITVNPLPIAVAGTDQTLCKGEPAQLGTPSQAENSYNWQPIEGLNDPTKSDPTASPVTTTQYILSVTNANGCTTRDTVLISIGNLIAIVSADTSICFGSSVKLSASGGKNYLWSPSTGLDNPTIANPTASPSVTTPYSVIVSSGECIDTAFVKVTVQEPPIADAGEDRNTCIGKGVRIGTEAIAGYSYSWIPAAGLSNPTESQPSASPTSTTGYILNVTNSSGCTNVDTVLVNVNPSNERLFTLSPSLVSILPEEPFQTTVHIPENVGYWRVRLGYDSLVVAFASIIQTTSSNLNLPASKNGQLFLSGTGGNDITVRFNAFLPYSPDTSFAIALTIDSAEMQQCETALSKGNTLELGEFCGKLIRNVSSTAKNYFFNVKERGINFGVGLTGKVRIELYDYTGTLKEVLTNGILEAGEYSFDFDLPIGLYFCRMNAGMYNDVQKIIFQGR